MRRDPPRRGEFRGRFAESSRATRRHCPPRSTTRAGSRSRNRAAAVHAFAQRTRGLQRLPEPRRTSFYPIWRDPDVLDTWFSSGLWPIGYARLARGHAPSLKRLLPHLRSRHRFRHHLLLGRPHDDDATCRRRRETVPHRLCPWGPRPRREGQEDVEVARQRPRPPGPRRRVSAADAVRFTLTAMAAMGARPDELSPGRIAGYRNFVTKLWNAARFAEMNGVFRGRARGPNTPRPEATANAWIRRRGRPGARGGRTRALAEFRFKRRRERALRLRLGYFLRLVPRGLETAFSER